MSMDAPDLTPAATQHLHLQRVMTDAQTLAKESAVVAPAMDLVTTGNLLIMLGAEIMRGEMKHNWELMEPEAVLSNILAACGVKAQQRSGDLVALKKSLGQAEKMVGKLTRMQSRMDARDQAEPDV